MKLLLDENLSRRLVPMRASVYPDSQHVEHLGLQGQSDIEIWRYAAEHGFVIVSKDDDFRQLSFLRGAPPKVIHLVLGNAGTQAVANLLIRQQAALQAFELDEQTSLLILH